MQASVKSCGYSLPAFATVETWVPWTIRWQASRSQSWPQTRTLPASPAPSSAWIAPPRHAVVHAEDRGQAVAVLSDPVLRVAHGGRGIPVGGPLLADDFHVAVLHAVEHAFLELHNAGAAGGVAVDVRNIAGDVHVADRLGDQLADLIEVVAAGEVGVGVAMTGS